MYHVELEEKKSIINLNIITPILSVPKLSLIYKNS